MPIMLVLIVIAFWIGGGVAIKSIIEDNDDLMHLAFILHGITLGMCIATLILT